MKVIYDCEDFRIECDAKTHYIIAKPKNEVVDTTPCNCNKKYLRQTGLESNSEQIAADELNLIANEALIGNRKAQNYLKKLWPECNWTTIKERLQTEGSVWYVWWMDGVRQYLQKELL